LKTKLFVLAALVLLSSINGIFFNNPIGVSAQEYDKADNYSTTAGNNEMVENYSYDDPGTYNADDDLYSNNDDAYGINQDNSEYSTYNNSYEPSSYDNLGQEYSSYDNYEDLYNKYLDDYIPDKSSSYDKDNNNYYDDSYYPPNKPKKLTCLDSGIVVDKAENCPLVCPAGTDLAGHLVAAGSNLQVVCDEDAAAQFETCGAGTDLAGVLVTNEPEDCNIFATCDANDPLGQALGLTGTETVEVADPQLCDLAIPSDLVLEVCPGGTNNAGALVTNTTLCEAPNNDNICPLNTDLEGAFVDDPATDCDVEVDVSIATNPQAQCIKCADLSVYQALNTVGAGPGQSFPQREASTDLIGTVGGENVFTICEDADTVDPTIAFNATLDITNDAQEALIETAFNNCVDRAPEETQSLSLQEMSFTTNVLPEAGISTFSSPPARDTEDLSALEKITKLKQQWMELSP